MQVRHVGLQEVQELLESRKYPSSQIHVLEALRVELGLQVKHEELELSKQVKQVGWQS